MSITILTTEDNSHTIFSEHYQAHYHSIHGAIEESTHVFISAGLFHLKQKNHHSVRIFEMGFGTGLNALLTLIEGQDLGLTIDYHTIESDPITLEDAGCLNFPSVLNKPELQSVFQEMHTCAWEEEHVITDTFSFKKSKARIENFNDFHSYNLIYYDAFAPSCQSELWENDIHQKLYDCLEPEGCLVTYCSQGAFRRTLESLGYRVERLNGPARKREMLRATKY